MNEEQKNAGSAQRAGRPVRKSDYWISVTIMVFVAAFFITVAAICYGIIVTPPKPGGGLQTLAFPWIGWFVAMLVSPAVILGFAQYIAGKTPVDAENGTDGEKEAAWAGQLTGRALKAYRLLKDAPLFMVCFALIALGATLLVIDGAFGLVAGVLTALVPYAPYFIGGITAFAIAIAVLMAYFRHANNKLAAEYAFRREVLEKTGVILLNETGKAILPPGGDRGKYAIGSIAEIPENTGPVIEATPVKALPEGTDEKADREKG
ncbi:MAG: hypothetical protein DELT_01986 [Desulfovibrio sp.]